mmetsp:Transcript_39260/g.59915  ORF Transcript_39260/g.59915 Transcript_39260/m.59915 type:complete len:148 (+) Transcript_39260:430-873(+)
MKMYTLKFNSPILPFSKFPLTQNKYIKDFLTKYDKDRKSIRNVLGVHFTKNSNRNASGAIGIEISIVKKNNITFVESLSNRRFQVTEFDPNTNFCRATPFEDDSGLPIMLGTEDEAQKALLLSEIDELKSKWVNFNTKINQVLAILP